MKKNNKAITKRNIVHFIIVALFLAMLAVLSINRWALNGGIRTERLEGKIIYEDGTVYIEFDPFTPLIPSRLVVEDRDFTEYAQVNNGKQIECDVRYIQIGDVVLRKISAVYYNNTKKEVK